MVAAVSILFSCHSWAISNASKWCHKLWNTKGMASLLEVISELYLSLSIAVYTYMHNVANVLVSFCVTLFTLYKYVFSLRLSALMQLEAIYNALS